MKLTALFVLCFAAGILHAQKSGSHEISLGIGGQFPQEKTPLNVAGKKELSSSVIGNGAYRIYVSELVSVGVRGMITSMKLDDYLVKKDASSVPVNANFSLSMLNAGLESQIYFSSRGHLRPYLSLQLMYAEQNLTSSQLGKLKGQGFLAGGGLGLRVKISETVLLSGEALAFFGSGEWKQKPAANSSGAEFDPSSFRAFLSAAFIIK